jgi:hypothetical protein
VVVDDFCLLPARICNKVIHVWNVESRKLFAGQWAPWEVTNGAESLVLYALQFQKLGVCCEMPHRVCIGHY